MDYSNYYPHYDQQHVQGAYHPSQPSQPYAASSIAGPSTAAAQPSCSYSYDPQQNAAYYHSQDYADYYHQQQQQPSDNQPSQHSQKQAAQEPNSGPWNFGVSACNGLQDPIGQSESSMRGGRRGSWQFRGRRSGSQGAQQGPTVGQVPASAPAQPSGMACCEFCKVECNSLEMLEQHKNGKRHKKNLRVHEELQNLKKQMMEPEKPAENLPSDTRPNVEDASGIGMKRKMKEGSVEKFVKVDTGMRQPVVSAQPKEPVFPFICELCNVKCEAQVVFNTHLAGKQHQSNLKKFEKNQCLYREPQVKMEMGMRQSLGSAQPKEPTFPFICELCNVKCETQAVFNTHLAGKKHLSNMRKLTDNQSLYEKAQMPVPPSASFSLPFTSPVSLEINNQNSNSDPLALLSVNDVSSSDPQVRLAQIIMDYVRSQTQGLPPEAQAPMPGSGSGTQNLQGEQIHDSEITLEASALPPAAGTDTRTTAASSAEAAPSGPESCTDLIELKDSDPQG